MVINLTICESSTDFVGRDERFEFGRHNFLALAVLDERHFQELERIRQIAIAVLAPSCDLNTPSKNHNFHLTLKVCILNLSNVSLG
jgi:hypothetical protein